MQTQAETKLSWMSLALLGLNAGLLLLGISIQNQVFWIVSQLGWLVLLVLYFLFFEKVSFQQLMVFLIPISLPITFDSGFSMSLPSELLVALLFLYLGLTGYFFRIDTRILKHPLTLLLLADLAWMLLCSVYSAIPEVSLKRTAIRTVYIGVYFFLFAETFLKEEKKPLRFYLLYAVAMLYPIFHAEIYHAQVGFSVAASNAMTKPFYNDHTIYGAALAMIMIPLGWMQSRSKGSNWLALLLLNLVLLAAMILSFSRASWLSLILAGLFGLLIHFRVRMVHLLFLTLTFSYLLFLNWDSLEDYMRRNDATSNQNVTEHLQSVANIETDASNKERLNRWKCAVRMFEAKPYMGYGPGTYQFVYGKFQVRSEMTRISTYAGNKGTAHSEYLTYLSETGLPGFLIFLATILYFISRSLSLIYESNGFRRGLVLVILLSNFTYLVHGLFNNFLDIDKIAMLYFVSMACLVAIDIRQRQDDKIMTKLERNV